MSQRDAKLKPVIFSAEFTGFFSFLLVSLDYMQKKRNLHEQLVELRNEIEIIKADETMNHLSSLDVDGLRKEKFATLQKVS